MLLVFAQVIDNLYIGDKKTAKDKALLQSKHAPEIARLPVAAS